MLSFHKKIAIILFFVVCLPPTALGIFLMNFGNYFSVGGILTAIIIEGLLCGVLVTFLILREIDRAVVFFTNGMHDIKEDINYRFPQVPGKIGIFVTEINNLAQNLQDTNTYYSKILENQRGSILHVSKGGRIAYLNRATCEFLGVPREEIIGIHYSELGKNKAAIPLCNKIKETLAVGKKEIAYDFLIDEETKLRIMSADFLPLNDENSLLNGVIVVIYDITEKRKLEELAQRSEVFAMIGEMAAGVVHEIRNPITSIKGFVQLLKQKYSDHLHLMEYADVMEKELNRANSILGEYLQLSRPSKAQLDCEDINKTLDELLSLAESDALLRDIEIKRETLGEFPSIYFDVKQIKQVFLNIISNAFAAMGNGGKLYVRSGVDGKMVFVEIKDTGCGMDELVLANMGRPFFTTKENGTGLGMSISFRIIQEHGGKISVQSKKGEGSTFTIYLPL